jgi:nucleoside-diphosphate-sugar epimerase
MSLVIGAAGAIGKRVIAGLCSRGDHVVAAVWKTGLPDHLQIQVAAQEMEVDVRDIKALRDLFRKHRGIDTVWNLAAPLSVETANDPVAAEATVVGGMSNILQVMRGSGVRRMMFTDSIGSYGASAPRENATARWLTENPAQDPESDYGIQKRACRELMGEFTEKHGGDTRWAVVPGVLHSDAVWGAGTTEYALEALLAAVDGRSYTCPVGADVMLPMIYADDLIRGLMALEAAPREKLKEPQQGYAMSGFSFSPRQLFEEMQNHGIDLKTIERIDDNMNKFANLWPDTVSAAEAQRDFGFKAKIGLAHTISRILRAHASRRKPGAAPPELSSIVRVP